VAYGSGVLIAGDRDLAEAARIAMFDARAGAGRSDQVPAVT
jgi:hypothetical protein